MRSDERRDQDEIRNMVAKRACSMPVLRPGIGIPSDGRSNGGACGDFLLQFLPPPDPQRRAEFPVSLHALPWPRPHRDVRLKAMRLAATLTAPTKTQDRPAQR